MEDFAGLNFSDFVEQASEASEPPPADPAGADGCKNGSKHLGRAMSEEDSAVSEEDEQDDFNAAAVDDQLMVDEEDEQNHVHPLAANVAFTNCNQRSCNW